MTTKSAILQFIFALTVGLVADSAIADEKQLSEMSLDDLMKLEVTSASKRSEKLSEVPSAVYVLTGEEIARSGARSVPEALRLVPGVTVAQVDASHYAISIRGFSGVFANKLLVLIDGRTTYTPFFSGTYWDVQDVLLQDVDRIEVIRGPGGSVWGANAVNGIINIITKKATDTLGSYIESGFGSALRYEVGAREGIKIGEHGALRVYGKSRGIESSKAALSGLDPDDSWHSSQGGFKFNNTVDRDAITIQGDVYDERDNQKLFVVQESSPQPLIVTHQGYATGVNLLGRVEHETSETSKLSAQFYYDRTERSQGLALNNIDTFDAEIQHDTTWGVSQNKFTWGAGYRMVLGDVSTRQNVTVNDSYTTSPLVSTFAQQEFLFLDHKLSATIGSKLEVNDTTGLEVQPSARLAYTFEDDSLIWGSLSRAVRTPSLADRGANIPFNTTALPSGGLLTSSLHGSKGYQSEDLLALEIGARAKVLPTVYLDGATFWYHYNDILSLEPGTPTPNATGTGLTLPFEFGNGLRGDSYGGELAAKWQASDTLRITAWYAYLFENLSPKPGSLDTLEQLQENMEPKNLASLWLSYAPTSTTHLDLIGRYVDNLTQIQVKSYTELTARLSYQVSPHIELSLSGYNLLDSAHREYQSTFVKLVPTEIRRSVFTEAKITF